MKVILIRQFQNNSTLIITPTKICCFIPFELLKSKRDSVRKAREAHLIQKAKAVEPFRINRRNEQ